MTADWTILSGMAHPELAAAIAHGLGARTVGRFPDGEVSVRIDEPVRDREVFRVQPTAPPVDEHLVELLAVADACRRASAARITAVLPYFGHARSDARHGRREPIVASMIARLIQAVGVARVVVVDLHTPQIEGFFQIALDTLTAVPTLCEALRARLPAGAVVVAPVAGRVEMATGYAGRLGAPLAVLHKRSTSGTETAVTHLVGDVSGRTCLIVDDIISTGGTIVESATALREAGAGPQITVAATHGLFVGAARGRLLRAGISRVFVTDTVPVAGGEWPELEVVPIAPLLAGAIRRLVADGSLSDLF
ncbi:ribose-phosphate pyrophosphokinase [Singulisphaera sp. Ch08]|uniref:ribose-phosphate diphosphokinase n=1 Tax=Singulisphaera sp. Ch08 TaxID=3120278 RepID=A0AAU7CEK1_9BACT